MLTRSAAHDYSCVDDWIHQVSDGAVGEREGRRDEGSENIVHVSNWMSLYMYLIESSRIKSKKFLYFTMNWMTTITQDLRDMGGLGTTSGRYMDVEKLCWCGRHVEELSLDLSLTVISDCQIYYGREHSLWTSVLHRSVAIFSAHALFIRLSCNYLHFMLFLLL